MRSSDRWTPRERDLPDEATLRRAPALHGMMDNPVFRRAMQRRRGSIWRSLVDDPTSFPGVLIHLPFAAWMILNWITTGGNGSSLIVMAVLFALGAILREHTLRGAGTGPLEIREWAELSLAGYPPVEAALGLWAAQLGPRGFAGWAPRAAGWGVLVLAILALERFAPGALDWKLFFGTATPLVLVHVAFVRRNPYASLVHARAPLEAERLRARAPLLGPSPPDDPRRLVWVILFESIFLLLFAPVWLAIPALVGTGLWAGDRFRIASIERVGENLDALVGEVASLMDRARRAIHGDDDPPPPPPSAWDRWTRRLRWTNSKRAS